MIQGNHDSESTITKVIDLPSNVYVFTGHGGVEELRDLGVAIHGVSYAQRHTSESLLPKYRQPVAGLINIGIMHTSLAGADGHDVYAPCAVSDLVTHGFDYWALGHIHRRRIYTEEPFVIMPGIPQGRDIGEDGPKSVTIVEISDKSIRIVERFVADSEFQRIQVNLTGIAEWPMAIAELRKAFEKVRSAAKARYVICRIVLLGRSPLYWRLRRDADLFEAEAKDEAKQLDDVLVDGVENQIEPPDNSTDDVDPVDELGTLMVEVARDSSFLTNVASFLETAISTLPSELRNCYGVDQDSREDILKRLLSQGTADVIASLKGSQAKLEIT
jgi:DNA repair exonuclease SbcCD nuclease subunit